MCTVPAFTVSALSACMPSSAAVTVTAPPFTVMLPSPAAPFPSAVPPFACRPSSPAQTVTVPASMMISFSAFIPLEEYVVLDELLPLVMLTQSPEIVPPETEVIRYPFIAVLTVSPVVLAL